MIFEQEIRTCKAIIRRMQASFTADSRSDDRAQREVAAEIAAAARRGARPFIAPPASSRSSRAALQQLGGAAALGKQASSCLWSCGPSSRAALDLPARVGHPRESPARRASTAHRRGDCRGREPRLPPRRPWSTFLPARPTRRRVGVQLAGRRQVRLDWLRSASALSGITS